MRLFTFVALLAVVVTALFAAPVALGQVAAPRLAPLAIGDVTANPAVQQWTGTSLIGAGTAYGDVDTERGSIGEVGEGDLTADSAAARLLGGPVSLGVETFEARLEARSFAESAPGEPDRTEEVTQQSTGAAATLGLGEWLTVGVGHERVRAESHIEIISLDAEGSAEETRTTPVGGLSLRLFNVVYLGAAMGRERIEYSEETRAGTTTDTLSFDEARDVRRAAAAVHWTGESFGIHLEAAAEQRTPIEVGGSERRETSTDAGVAEVKLGGVLVLGYGQTHYRERNEDTSDVNSRTTTATVGIAPPTSWTLVARLHDETRKTENSDLFAGDDRTDETRAVQVALGYRF